MPGQSNVVGTEPTVLAIPIADDGEMRRIAQHVPEKDAIVAVGFARVHGIRRRIVEAELVKIQHVAQVQNEVGGRGADRLGHRRERAPIALIGPSTVWSDVAVRQKRKNERLPFTALRYNTARIHHRRLAGFGSAANFVLVANAG